MDPRILAIIAAFHQWRGDTYRLAMLIVEMQREVDKERLAAAGFVDAVEVL